ncbi:MAG: hypothetical protein AAF960_09635 [Bacteroidota bacterium]
MSNIYSIALYFICLFAFSSTASAQLTANVDPAFDDATFTDFSVETPATTFSDNRTEKVPSTVNVDLGTLDFNNSTVEVSANVVKEMAVLQYQLDQPERISIQLVDAASTIVKHYTRRAKRAAGTYEQQIILPYDLTKGTYSLRIISESGQIEVAVQH